MAAMSDGQCEWVVPKINRVLRSERARASAARVRHAACVRYRAVLQMVTLLASIQRTAQSRACAMAVGFVAKAQFGGEETVGDELASRSSAR